MTHTTIAGPTAECFTCGHGALTPTGDPPAQCDECGGVYGTAFHPGRCYDCNRKRIARAAEIAEWLAAQLPADPCTVTITTTPGGNEPPGQTPVTTTATATTTNNRPT